MFIDGRRVHRCRSVQPEARQMPSTYYKGAVRHVDFLYDSDTTDDHISPPVIRICLPYFGLKLFRAACSHIHFRRANGSGFVHRDTCFAYLMNWKGFVDIV